MSAEKLPLPDTLAALIAGRLDGLPAERKALLADAAVLGRVFWSGGVVAVGDRGEADVRLALRDLARAESPAMPGNRLATAEAPTCCRRGH